MSQFHTGCDWVLVLASSSPRRSELLREWGYGFTLINAPVSEELADGILPESGVQELSGRKALSGFKAWRNLKGNNSDLILGADTIVVLNGRILGKPVDEKEAEEMLLALSGKTHKVLTAIALAGLDHDQNVQIQTDYETTGVSFRKLSRTEILDYIATGEPMDKAAAYGIQGEAQKFASKVKGSLTNVIGLPMELLSIKLKEKGIFPNNIRVRG